MEKASNIHNSFHSPGIPGEWGAGEEGGNLEEEATITPLYPRWSPKTGPHRTLALEGPSPPGTPEGTPCFQGLALPTPWKTGPEDTLRPPGNPLGPASFSKHRKFWEGSRGLGMNKTLQIPDLH